MIILKLRPESMCLPPAHYELAGLLLCGSEFPTLHWHILMSSGYEIYVFWGGPF